MTDFKNTSKWEKKDANTILYRYDYQGKQTEGKLEREPHILHVQLDRLSVMDTTAWTFADKKHPDSPTSFHPRDYIKVEGKRDLARVHVFTFDETPTTTFDRIEVSIYPIPLEAMQAASTYNRWALLDNKDRPDDGWLKDEHGRIDYFEANEYFDRASISAILRLDQDTFDTVVRKIKSGGKIRNARLEILADLFQFGYEGFVSGPMTTSNYGLPCEHDERRVKGHTKARLEELMLEWSSNLEKHQPDLATLDHWPIDATDGQSLERALSGLAADVKQIRARLEFLYQVGVAAVAFVLVRYLVLWLG